MRLLASYPAIPLCRCQDVNRVNAANTHVQRGKNKQMVHTVNTLQKLNNAHTPSNVYKHFQLACSPF